MEISYQQQHFHSKIIYGETLKRAIPKTAAKGKHVIILTNQRYYDRSFEKISRFFEEALDLDWYICGNDLYCNKLSELMDLLNFLERFPQNREYLLVAYGNEGVMQLTGFTAETTLLATEFWSLPVSVRSLAKALELKQEIVKNNDRGLLQVKKLPTHIFYDQTLTEAQNEGKLVDLLVFIRCGIVCDHSFLQELFKNYANKQRLYNRSFAALIAPLIGFYQEDYVAIEDFGELFERAFYDTENGNLLSANMKRLFGTIFHLIWSQEASEGVFHLKNFLVWLIRCGFPVILPEQISLNDYADQVLQLAQKQAPLPIYEKIGQIKEYRVPTAVELIRMNERYEMIINEIRG